MMPIDAFLDDAVLAYRGQLARDDTRAGAEDAITLLTDYRLSEIDERGFELLLARLTRGRSPVALLTAQPQMIAVDLSDRWQAYQQRRAVLAHA
ncbi:MAG TPA: hypothetical protein VIE40_02350 [Dehalococcoidia bacterium]